jgi:hypothetical protein
LFKIIMSKEGKEIQNIDYSAGFTKIIPCKQDDLCCVDGKIAYKPSSKTVGEFNDFLKEYIENDFKNKDTLKAIFPTDKKVFVLIVQFLRDESAFSDKDLDNMARTVLNALNGIIYKDDKQVAELYACKKVYLQYPKENFAISDLNFRMF